MFGDAVTAVAVATVGSDFDFPSQWDCVTHSTVRCGMEIYWKPKFLSMPLCDAGECENNITKRRSNPIRETKTDCDFIIIAITFA